MTKIIATRTIIAALLMLAAVTALSPTARAVDIESGQREGFGVAELEDALPSEAREIVGDMSVMDSVSYDSFFSKIGAAAKSKFSELLRRMLKSSVTLLTVALLCSLAGCVYSGDIPDFIPLCGAVAVSAVALGDVRSFIGMGTESLYRLSDFSKALLPTIASAAAASGAVTSASVKYVASVFFIDLLLAAVVNILMPLVYAYIAVIIANAALGGETLEAVCKLVKWICTSMLTILMLAFTGYLSLSGIVSGAADATVIKITKSAISSALPVVGGIISDAADTIIAGAGMLRNTIGVFGVIAVVAICLMPFLTLGLQYLLYKLTAGVAGVLSDKRIGGLISGMGSAFGIVLGLIGSGAVMIFISLISSMRAVSGT